MLTSLNGWAVFFVWHSIWPLGWHMANSWLMVSTLVILLCLSFIKHKTWCPVHLWMCRRIILWETKNVISIFYILSIYNFFTGIEKKGVIPSQSDRYTVGFRSFLFFEKILIRSEKVWGLSLVSLLSSLFWRLSASRSNSRLKRHQTNKSAIRSLYCWSAETGILQLMRCEEFLGDRQFFFLVPALLEHFVDMKWLHEFNMRFTIRFTLMSLTEWKTHSMRNVRILSIKKAFSLLTE